MPKAFSEREKEIIHERLLSSGRQLFETYGLRKTSVEELARAAAISKGAFYIFYASKEALFLEIVEQFEVEFRRRIFENTNRSGHSHRENFKALLREAFQIWREHPLLRHFNQEDFQYLARKLPEGTVQRHFQTDEAAVAGLVEQWRALGMDVQVDPVLLTDLMKALFFISLHEDDFGSGYNRTLEVLIELISGLIFKD